MRAPAARMSSIRSWCLGRSSTIVVMSLTLRPNAWAIARTFSPIGFSRSIFPRARGPTAILRMYMSGRVGKESRSPTAIIDMAPFPPRATTPRPSSGSSARSIGAGGPPVDLALDPLEGRGVVARGGNGAMSMIAVGDRDSLPTLPDMYMRKMAVGPLARGKIDLLKPMGENVRAIAQAFGRNVNDITTIVLDRPRHHDLIEDIRAAGARIKLIQDGTVTASISAAIRGTTDHLAVGIGGTRQAVMSAAALRCLGGEVQAQLWPTTRREIEQARDSGIEDTARVFTGEDLAAGDVIFAATGVSNGDLLRGVRFLTDSARTHSIVMCTRCNWVRFVDGIHFFRRERREEVRLSGL